MLTLLLFKYASYAPCYDHEFIDGCSPISIFRLPSALGSSPDGKLIVLTSSINTMYIIDAFDGTLVREELVIVLFCNSWAFC